MNCLQCHSSDPKYYEDGSPARVFCNLECQKFFHIGLTSQKDTDVSILLQLPLKELFKMRQISHYYKNLIDTDDSFFERLMMSKKPKNLKPNREFINSMRGKWSPEKIRISEYVWGIKTEIPNLKVLEELARKTYFDPTIGNFAYVRSAIFGDETSIFKKLLEFPDVLNGYQTYFKLLIDDEKYDMLSALLLKLPKRNLFEEIKSAAIDRHRRVYELLYKYTLPLSTQQERIISNF